MKSSSSSILTSVDNQNGFFRRRSSSPGLSLYSFTIPVLHSRFALPICWRRDEVSLISNSNDGASRSRTPLCPAESMRWCFVTLRHVAFLFSLVWFGYFCTDIHSLYLRSMRRSQLMWLKLRTFGSQTGVTMHWKKKLKVKEGPVVKAVNVKDFSMIFTLFDFRHCHWLRKLSANLSMSIKSISIHTVKQGLYASHILTLFLLCTQKLFMLAIEWTNRSSKFRSHNLALSSFTAKEVLIGKSSRIWQELEI